MTQREAGFTESEYRLFFNLFVFWGKMHSEIGVKPSWAGIWPNVVDHFPVAELSARNRGGDPGYIIRREGRAVRRYWIERGSLDSVGECGYFIDAMKFMAATLASDYRDAKGYEQLYLKLKGVMPDGVAVSIMDGREVYRLMGHDPDRYIPVYGVPGGISPYFLTHSLDQVNADLLRP